MDTTKVNPILLRVSLRYKGLCINTDPSQAPAEMTPAAAVLTERLIKCGYICEEPLARALNSLDYAQTDLVAETLEDILGLRLNWAPLVKGWLRPTGETRIDHLVTLIMNIFPTSYPGVTLECGHFIPEGTFPLDRYNGCPFCGRQLRTSCTHFTGQGSRLKPLRLITEDEMRNIHKSLLESSIPLDSTGLDSAMLLTEVFGIPENADIKMKETVAAIAGMLVEKGDVEQLCRLMRTPDDVLRYLWRIKTGKPRLIKPATLLKLAVRNNLGTYYSDPGIVRIQERYRLRLHYSRRECRLWAKVTNATKLSPEQAAENMNPQRQMWVRFIRALRLPESARRPGMERLRSILDLFYRKDYQVWQGNVDRALARVDTPAALALLRQRPGAFSRQLFSTMLTLGARETIESFAKIASKVPLRLLFTLSTNAATYFTSTDGRVVRPITGLNKLIPSNPRLQSLTTDEAMACANEVSSLVYTKVTEIFSSNPAPGVKIYIAPQLYNIPIAVSDRTDSIQDTETALQGMRFPLEGDNVRLFMQWGKGLPAQHLDMDLTARVLYADGNTTEVAYYNLSIPGGCHSGDIREIPKQVGTAEYIELDVKKLEAEKAEYVVFTCNAYSSGAISPNLTVGWMDSKYPMKVSEQTGVAYDPSTVIFQTRIPDKSYVKGLVFGVLDIKSREIIWLELPFTGQLAINLNLDVIRLQLKRLEAKPNIGECLERMAEARKMVITSANDADEFFIDPIAATDYIMKG